MVQRDYILREIEKMGAVMTAIRHKLFGGKENLSLTLEMQVEYTKETLLREANFDLGKLMDLDIEKSKEYLTDFAGFNIRNIESLAQCLSQIGKQDKSDSAKKHLEKALQLYEICNLISKTWSLEREENTQAIKNVLSNI